MDEATYYTCDDADELTHHMKDDVYTYFTYDNDGNQTSKKVGESLCYYNYDADNMLTSFTDGDTDADYVYDAAPGIRRRVKSAVDDTVTYYAFDDLNVLTDYDSDVSAERSYVVPFLDDSLLLRTGGSDYHYGLDVLGSVYSLTDGNEAVQNDYLYEAFGSTHGTPAENVTNRLRFTGREWNTTLSLYQYRARIYASALGRFLCRDAVQIGDEVNLYTYGGNCPTVLVDPLGQKPGFVDWFTGKSRFWDFVDCMAACIEDNDPIDQALAKAAALAAGVRIPKTIVAKVAKAVGDNALASAILRTRRMPGQSKWTTIPSAVIAKIKMGAGGKRVLRALGKYGHAASIAYGLALAAIEAWCAQHCCRNRHYNRGDGNILDQVKSYFD